MQFLDKLKILLTKSHHINYATWNYLNSEQLYICIGAAISNFNPLKEIYINDYINFLKDDSIDLPYHFMIDIFDENNYNISMLDEVLTINPNEEELLVIFKHTKCRLNNIKTFINLLNTKNSFIKMTTFGNNHIKRLHDKEFLDMCFSHGNKFDLLPEDYSNILIGYINNSSFFQSRDELLALCFNYIKDEKILQSLTYKMYGQKTHLTNMIVEKKLTYIEINRLHLIKNYTLISENVLESLLEFFVQNISTCLIDLPSTSSIEYLVNIDNYCDITDQKISVFRLLLDTTNSNEVLDIFDCYLKLFVQFNNEDNNNSINNFKQYIQESPHIFQNFILHQKLGKKLAVKFHHNVPTKI